MATPYRTGTGVVTGTAVLTGQEIDPMLRVQISFDDISVPEQAATWTDVTATYPRSWGVQGGRDTELDDFDAATMNVILDNRDRRFEPGYASSPYYPNVVPNRRIQLTCETNNTVYRLFKGYVDGWGPSWVYTGFGDATANVTATDGGKILAGYKLPASDPDVEDYDEVINTDDPAFYYRLGEPAGTKLVAHTRWIKKGRKPRRRKRWKTRETRAPVDGVSGPSGTYKNTPALGQPGAIAGDPDAAVLFRATQSEYAQVDLDTSDLIDTNRLTLSAWCNPVTFPAGGSYIVSGPYSATPAESVFGLVVESTGQLGAYLRMNGGPDIGITSPNSLSTGVSAHAAVTWDGATAVLYLNGIQVATAVSTGTLRSGSSQFNLGIGCQLIPTGPIYFFDGYIDEVAVYEKALSADRVLAHYQAGLLGLNAAYTGRRVADTLTLVGEWPAWNMQTGTRTMRKRRYAGLEPRTLIDEAVDGEGLPAAFFFAADGTPTFLDSNYRAAAPYNTPRYTFGPAGGTDIPYQDVTIDDTDAFLHNVIVGTTQDGISYTAQDATSISRYGRKALTLDDLPHDNPTDLQTYVDALLARYKDPMIRITGFTLNSQASTAAKDALLALRLGDQVTVKIQPPGGGAAITQSSYVERRELSQDETEAPILGTFAISPR